VTEFTELTIWAKFANAD